MGCKVFNTLNGFTISRKQMGSGAVGFVHDMYGTILDMTFLDRTELVPIFRENPDIREKFKKMIEESENQ